MKEPNPACPTTVTLNVIGGRWKVSILYLLFLRPHRFAELRRKLTPVTEKMLIQQLRELESDGVVQRRVFGEVPPKVEYSLTSHGESLRPVIDAMVRWGLEHQYHPTPNPEVPLDEKCNAAFMES
ncbi:winged helix-turn-helix transcriptional regulator [Deinococcus misasensis]|uniref:winged helix-turn-helix transcriptional regulator n=1 Tax=Deinococcus misasensis TaxID=392413 RepID=UPI00068F104F|nr:helix-turn-helix domain-containing protein [Deinococcus misasensis]